MDDKKQGNFEKDLKELEEIVDQLEQGGMSLDDSILLFEKGQKLLARCRNKLEKAQVTVYKLSSDGTSEEIDPESLGR